MILDGKILSAKVKCKLAEKTLCFEKKFGRKPCLAVVLAGDDVSSKIYVDEKKRACDEVGFSHVDITFDNSVTQKKILETVEELNNNPDVDGILVQLPLPQGIDELAVINSIKPQKDVDGFTPYNIGCLLLGQKKLVACTPKGILRLLDEYDISTQKKNVCIVGRSNIVGKPLAALLVQKDRNATVTVCNSFTQSLNRYIKEADIVISAAGKVNLITAPMVKEGAVVVDVGMNRIKDSSKKSGYALKGDVDFENVSKVASAITPVPGGVGPMTIAMLMENTLIAACSAKGIEAQSL